MALGNFDDILEFNDMVLSTLQIPSSLCLVIKLVKFCSNITNLPTPQSNNYETMQPWSGYLFITC